MLSCSSPGRAEERKLKNLHSCMIYQTDAEHRALLTSFLREGLARNQKVVYVSDGSDDQAIRRYLSQDGRSLDPYLNKGQLNILDVQATYLSEGPFDPDGMIDLLRWEARRALAEGYSGLRFTGEMTWALQGNAGSERLIEYEAKMNEALDGEKVLTLCQYDRRRFSPSILVYMLASHPLVFIGQRVYENFYYRVSPAYLGQGPASTILSRWLGDLVNLRWECASFQSYEPLSAVER